MGSAELIPPCRVPGDVTGLPPAPAAGPHRDTGAAAGLTPGRDVTHCGR